MPPNQDKLATNQDDMVGGNGWFWSLDLLREFAEGVHTGSRLTTSAQKEGVVTEPAVDYVGPERIIFPVLHVPPGFGNNWLKSFIREMQAASEAYHTVDYLEAEEAVGNVNKQGARYSSLNASRIQGAGTRILEGKLQGTQAKRGKFSWSSAAGPSSR